MALTATVRRFEIELSDVDRNVYASLDVRVAQHPSEDPRFLVTRVLAWCLRHEEGIAFSKGVSDTDEPAVYVKEPDGRMRVWIEIGLPSADRLHRASKHAAQVAVYTHRDPGLLVREARSRDIHNVERIEAFALAPAFLDALAATIERTTRWEIVHTGGHLYVTTQKGMHDAPLVRVTLGASAEAE